MRKRSKVFVLLLTFTIGMSCGFAQTSAPQPLANGSGGGPDGYVEAGQVTANVSILRAAIRDTSNIMNNIVTIKLTAPSGTTGDFSLYLPSGFSDPTGLVYSLIPFTALAPGSQDLKLPFDNTISTGEYHDAHGIWDANVPGAPDPQTVDAPDYTFPKKWDFFRKVRFTRYNTPYESSCSGTNATAYIVSETRSNGKTACSFTPITLNSNFIFQVWLNGTGVTVDHGVLPNGIALPNGTILKNAAVDPNKLGSGKGQACRGQYPSGAIGSGTKGNTFSIVTEITGACGVLRDQVSAAAPAINGAFVPLSNVVPLNCNYQLNLDSGNYVTAVNRVIADKCPACGDPANNGVGTDGTTNDGHVDSYTNAPACSAHHLGGDLPGSPFYTSNVTK